MGRKEGRMSPQERERAVPLQEGLFAEQAFLERQDQELLRRQNALWARDAGVGAKHENVLAASLEIVAAAAKNKPFKSSKAVVGAGESVDVQEEDGEQAGGDGIAAAFAGIATGVLAALAAAAGGTVASAAPESLSELSKTALFAADDAVAEEPEQELPSEGSFGSQLQAPGGGAGGLRGAGNAGRGWGVGGDAARGGVEAGGGVAGGDVHRVLQVT